MRNTIRQIVRQRDVFRCLYCGMRESDVGAELTVDHYQPRSRGGSDDLSNLVYCCHACNEFKGDYWQPGSIERILNPLTHDVAAHLYEDENGSLQPLTETGAFHAQRLQLNRPQLIASRQHRQRAEADAATLHLVHQNTSLLTEQVQIMQAEIDELHVLLDRYLP